MPEKKEYRSALRSRKMIRDAFIQLVEEKKNGKVTVTDIVNRADINRSTFYAHYQDVQSVAEEIENELIGHIMPFLEVSYTSVYENPLFFLEKIGRIMEKNKDLCRIIIKSQYADHFEKSITEMITNYVLHSKDVPDMIRQSPFFDMMIVFLIGGIMNVLYKWLLENSAYTLDDLIREMEKHIQTEAGSQLNLGWGLSVKIPN